MNKNQAESIISSFKKAIAPVEEQIMNELVIPALRAGARNPGCVEAMVDLKKVMDILVDNPDFVTFMGDYANVTNIPEVATYNPKIKGIQIVRVSLGDIYIDMTNQRPTDFLRCLRNIIMQDGYNGEHARVINAYRRPDGKFVVTDGGHRCYMALLAGRTEIEVFLIVHEEDATMEEMLEREGTSFEIINDTAEAVEEIYVYRSRLLRGYDDEVKLDEFFTYVGLDAAYTQPEDGLIKVKKVRNYMTKYICIDKPKKKKDSGFTYTFDWDDFKIMLQEWESAYPGEEFVDIRTVNSLARLYWAIRQNANNMDKWGFEFDTDSFIQAFSEYASKYSSSHLTSIGKVGNKDTEPADDFATMTKLFKDEISTAAKKKMLKLWCLQDTINYESI